MLDMRTSWRTLRLGAALSVVGTTVADRSRSFNAPDHSLCKFSPLKLDSVSDKTSSTFFLSILRSDPCLYRDTAKRTRKSKKS